MSDAIQLELVKNIPSIAAAVSGMFAAYFGYKAHQVSRETKEIAKQTEQNTNHLKDELVAEVRKAAHAEGIREGEQHN